jgi:hypothetical protein
MTLFQSGDTKQFRLLTYMYVLSEENIYIGTPEYVGTLNRIVVGIFV